MKMTELNKRDNRQSQKSHTIQQKNTANVGQMAFAPVESTTSNLLAQMKAAQEGVQQMAFAPPAQLQCAHCQEEEKTVQKKSNENGMPTEVQAKMEQTMGHDFSNVKIHQNSQSSVDAGALAYAQGNDVHFAPGQFKPNTTSGQELIGHELAHVAQQREGRVKPTKMLGKGMAVNDDPGLEKEADDMGRKAAQSIKQSIEGGAIGEEPAFAQNLGAVKEPIVQRSTAWSAGAVHETINLAEQVRGGSSPITWPTLNGTKLSSNAVATAALNDPTITTTETNGVWTATVVTVPLNSGSFDETVLSPGPWTSVITKAEAGVATGLPACSGAGVSTFRAKGNPSDNSVYEANRRHENHHASDHEKAFGETIKKWDEKLEQARNGKKTFEGSTSAEATDKLWVDMGGTPAEIAAAYFQLCVTYARAFHGTPAGGTMRQSNPSSNADCTTSSIDVINPS